MVDPRQTYIAPDVRLDRIAAGATLHPGTRLQGSTCWLGKGAEVGTEGPATIIDSVLDTHASVASGFVKGAVLLSKASLGANAHVRSGTLLEEEASTAHAVGLKQTLLLSFVTLGSLINFCDCLMAGGTSRQDHAEVGSGYIHFNFTPWGKRGDKATPSLIGDVARGVFLRERRIFLGGTGGLVGPARVGYGAVAGAGQVVRNGIKDGRLVIQQGRALDRAIEMNRLDPILPRAERNVVYIANLFALRCWYEQVRMPGIPRDRKPVMDRAIALLNECIAERKKQLRRFIEERDGRMPQFVLDRPPPCPLPTVSEHDHVQWVKGLSDGDVVKGMAWLDAIVASVATPALTELGAK